MSKKKAIRLAAFAALCAAASSVDAVPAITAIPQNNTTIDIPFMMVQSADHITPLTGASPTVQIHKQGGSFAAATGSIIELGSGWYSLTANATDANTTGALLGHATAASGDPADFGLQVFASSSLVYATGPTTLAAFQTLTALNVNGGTLSLGVAQINSGGITAGLSSTITGSLTGNVGGISGITFPTNFGVELIDSSGRISLAPTQTNTTFTGIQIGSGQITLSAINTNGGTITFGIFQVNSGFDTSTFVGSLTGSVGSVIGAVGSVTGAVGSVTGNVGGNVVGSVGSISGITFPTNFSAFLLDSNGRVSLAASQTNTTFAGIQISSGQETLAALNTNGGTVTFNILQVNSGFDTSTFVGSLTGSVGSVVGAAGSVSGAVGSVTGNVGGNVVGSVGSIAGITFPTNFSAELLDSSGRMSLAPTQTNTTFAGLLISSGQGTLSALNVSSGTLTFGLEQINSGFITSTFVGNLTGSIGSITGITFPAHFSAFALDSSGDVTYNNAAPPTVAAISTGILTDTTDITTHGSLGWLNQQWISDQASPTSATSAFTAAALVNAPTGGGGSTDVETWNHVQVSNLGGLPNVTATVTLPTNPPPGYGGVILTGTVGTSSTTAIANAPLAFPNNYTLNQSLQATGLNSTGWSQMLFTIKPQVPNPLPDAKSVLQLQISSPPQASDGMRYGGIGGAGSITVGGVTPNTIVTLAANPKAMNIPAGTYRWEWTIFNGGAKQLIGYGTVTIQSSVLQTPGANP